MSNVQMPICFCNDFSCKACPGKDYRKGYPGQEKQPTGSAIWKSNLVADAVRICDPLKTIVISMCICPRLHRFARSNQRDMIEKPKKQIKMQRQKDRQSEGEAQGQHMIQATATAWISCFSLTAFKKLSKPLPM